MIATEYESFESDWENQQQIREELKENLTN